MKKRLKKKFYYSKFRKVLVKMYRGYILDWMYPHLYRKNAKKPVNKNKVVFIEVRDTKISDNFELIYNKLKKEYKAKISVHYLRMGFSKRLENTRLSKAMVRDIADAKYVFLSDSSDVIGCLSMRSETVVTQLWHACGAFKKFGMSTAELIFGDDRKTLEKHPYHSNYTHVTVSSEEVVWAYEEAMSLQDKKGIVKPVGVSRTDVFYDEKYIESARERLYKKFPYAKGKKVILYAPTFRGRVAKAKSPNVLNIAQMSKAFSDEYVLIFKHHPFVKSRTVIEDEFSTFAADFTDTMSIEDLLCVSDICISDYSSLVFEYSLFERPMIFLAHDLDEYFDWRGFYYDYKDFVPGPIFSTTDEIIEYIANIDDRFDKKQVTDFKEKFMSACDGKSTDRIMKLVFGNNLIKKEA